MAESGSVRIQSLPKSLSSASVERTGPNSLRATIGVGGTPRPSSRTDIVFILDVSATNRAAIESGGMADTVWKVLEYVNQFDDDGIDFFLASTLEESGAGPKAVLAALESGRAPTAAELAAAHGAREAGQAATREELNALLEVDGSVMGLAGVLAPALRLARTKRKDNGRLFIEVVTDANVVDVEAVTRQIVEMSRECESSADKARYRLHMLGIGDIDRANLERWDSGLGDLAPIDIVATDAATDLHDGAQQVFKEMRRSFMSVCQMALLEVSAPNLVDVRAMGGAFSPDEAEKGKFVESREQLPPELIIDLSFTGTPAPTSLNLTMMRDDGSEDSCVITLPVP